MQVKGYLHVLYYTFYLTLAKSMLINRSVKRNTKNRKSNFKDPEIWTSGIVFADLSLRII